MVNPVAFVNGRIWGHSRATALLANGGYIMAIGFDDEIRERAGNAEIEDLEGRLLLPGFIDSHTHFHRTALMRYWFIDFDDPSIQTLADVLDAVARRAAQLEQGDWVQGDNLAPHRLRERRFPTRWELDRVAPRHPVVLRGLGKHVVAANSLALSTAKIDRSTANEPGGRIERDEAGEPTGILHERAKGRLDATRADTVVPRLGEVERVMALRSGIEALLAKGVTALHEIIRTPDEFADYQRLREQSELDIRVHAYVRVLETRVTIDHLLDLGVCSGLGDEWLSIAGVKVSIDGSCTFRNAATYEPYPGEPENRGILRIDETELRDVVVRAHSGGLAVAVHAIGPRAVDMALAAFEEARNRTPDRHLAHRVEHAYLAPLPGQLKRMRDLGLVYSTQPSFIYSLGDEWVEIFGPERAQLMMPLRSAHTCGLSILINSDCPTAPVDPLLAIASAVTRRTRQGVVLGAAEKVPVEQAVTWHTASPAMVVPRSQRTGLLQEGFAADLVVLDADPRDVAPEEIADIPVHMTIVGGRMAYRHEC